MSGTFATSISCIDGRVQEPLMTWIRERYGVDHVDVISEPGVDGLIGGAEAALRAKAEISVRAHSSRGIVVSGHHDCAANPASEGEHLEMIRRAVSTVSSWNLGPEVAGAWVDGSWGVTPVS
ncbi:conserved hypothetical protein [Nitrosopumilaceae archaeon]|nr:hypothetical protein [Nitrosopumilus sp.]CAI9832721.1 conserved hypothetical protein [Nitrosopumilaceae archaeon]MDA7944675.1 hypothetical protein [Nitrosopumilus sp.]MDA7954566.1 hypothetical protein [Nitrosopumilus sp.]MDA7973355.1 hypothetical protein [Nitrosopumilus sp.]